MYGSRGHFRVGGAPRLHDVGLPEGRWRGYQPPQEPLAPAPGTWASLRPCRPCWPRRRWRGRQSCDLGRSVGILDADPRTGWQRRWLALHEVRRNLPQGKSSHTSRLRPADGRKHGGAMNKSQARLRPTSRLWPPPLPPPRLHRPVRGHWGCANCGSRITNSVVTGGSDLTHPLIFLGHEKIGRP